MKLSKNGFTLLELVVVVGVMGILGMIFTNVLINSLRSQSKVKVINQIKENGQVVLDRLADEIRQADQVICIDKSISGQPANSLVVLKKDTYSLFRLIPSQSPSANGYIMRNDFTADDFTTNITQNRSQLCTGFRWGNSPISFLSDQDAVTGVSVDFDNLTDAFSRNHSDGYNDSVVIKLRISQGVKSGNTYESSMDENGIVFTTTVQLRGGKK